MSLKKRSKYTVLFHTTMIAALVLVSTARARADRVVVGFRNYPGSRIIDFKEGRIEFRAASGDTHFVSPADVTLIGAKGADFESLNEAEALAAEEQFAAAAS